MARHTLDVVKRVFRINQTASHHRSLHTAFGYNAILDVDLVEECLALLALQEPPVRVLDVGCGDGFALSQLQAELEARGVGDAFLFYGMGVNWYEPMYLPYERFLFTGLHAAAFDRFRFDLVISVFAFHYLWHKLEGIEKLHNRLLADGGLAILHFPGYLVHAPKYMPAAETMEEEGHADFARFIAQHSEPSGQPQMHYDITTLLSDDGDRTELGRFGRLSFQREPGGVLDWGLSLAGFGVVPKGFRYNDSRREHPDYVVSYYHPRQPGPPSQERLWRKVFIEPDESSPAKAAARQPALHCIVDPRVTGRIILSYPGFRESADSEAIAFDMHAERLLDYGLGAVVRMNNPYQAGVDYPTFLVNNLRRTIDRCLGEAESICGTPEPTLYLCGYSAGASAIAAVAAAYPQIARILLIAPSVDAGEDAVRESLPQFAGDVYIISGADDPIVMPSQARRFYHYAGSARRRALVILPDCGHSFEGAANQEIMDEALFWAFADSACFPEPELEVRPPPVEIDPALTE
jgi:SAM-dependent methyltransferase